MLTTISIISQLIFQDEFQKHFNLEKRSLTYFKDAINQDGGGHKIKLVYNNEEFSFRNIMDEIYILRSKNSSEDCITLNIDKKNKVVNINNISAVGGILCFKQITPKKGTLLLELAIKFAKKLKKEKYYDVNKIFLTDNSSLYCTNNKYSIPLSNIKLIISGETFYSSHGFLPISEKDRIMFNNNKKILKNLLIKDVDLEKYINNFIEEYKNVYSLKSLNSIINFIKNNRKMYLGSFFEIISNKESFNENCQLVDYLINQIFDDLKIKSMYNMKYEMYI